MGKRLLVVWDGKTLHDDEVDEIVWSDNASGVSVQGKVKRPGGANPSGGGGLLDMLTSARKQQTAEIVEARKAEVVNDLPPEVVAAE